MPISEKSVDKSWVNGQKPYNVFYIWYTELCRRINMTPLTSVKPAKLKNENVLDFIVDRIKLDEWNPILRALRQDTSLHVLAIRSRVIKAGNKFLPDVDTREKVRNMKKRCSLILTPYILNMLVKSITVCIQNSPVLSSLELDGLPIHWEYFESINASLNMNRSIRVLSFMHCPIGDQGCEILAKNLRTLPNIEIINLTSCELGPQSAQQLAKVIKFQQINRYCESWHCSLRYEDPEIGRMTGLKRITLNNNSRIGDEGLSYILNELDDDLWIKALDMQRCSITEKSARRLIDVVEYSKSLEVADFRNNDLSPGTIERILDLLNSKQNKDPEFHWCYTTSTLPCNDSVYDVCSLASSCVQKTKSAPLRKLPPSKSMEDNGFPLRRAKTFSLLQKRSEPRVFPERRYPQVDELGQAKKEILNLGNKLKIEMSKRRQIEQENIHLKKQLLEVKKSSEEINKNKKSGKLQLKIHVPRVSTSNMVEKKEKPLIVKNNKMQQKRPVTFLFPSKKDDKSKVQQIFMNFLQNPPKNNRNDDKVNKCLKMYKEYKNLHEEIPEKIQDANIDSNESLQMIMNELQRQEENYEDDDLHLSLDSNEDYDDSIAEDQMETSLERDEEANSLLSYMRQYNYENQQYK